MTATRYFETTLVIFKPDAVKRGLVGRILQRFEDKQLKILRLESRFLPNSVVQEHYAEHKGKSFFPDLVEAMVRKQVVVAALEGYRAVELVRILVGDLSTPRPGTIRGDFAPLFPKSANLVHASDSVTSAQRELEIFFPSFHSSNE